MENKTNSIVDFLLEHRASDPVWFHMPGHKGSKIYRENGFGEILDALMDCDITEIPGADNL
ncbi:MAG: arginine decarboxylase, partial [Clostridia bacterium]|nr:arginine decarboxylase [Clostridia bacterium]